MSASLSLVSERDWSAEDTFSIHFRTRSGADGVIQSSCGAWGPFLICARIAGSRGTLWIEGDCVQVADASGTRTLAIPDDLCLSAPVPPDPTLLTTAYDMMHSLGIDLPPYIRLYEVFRDRIRGLPTPADPAPGSFADGVAGMEILDAIRRSSAEHAWVSIGK